jgi:hypothetical protein
MTMTTCISEPSRLPPRFPIDTPPWKRKSPTRAKSAPLTEIQKAAARKRAESAGRRYPNLVDNMWAARHVERGPVSSEAHQEEE